jgi:phenylacetate-CoA ligase
MAYETPFSIAAKKLAEGNARFLETLTGDPMFPQWFQYNPLLRYIESVGGELVSTSASGLPLVRFNIHDRGDVLPLEQVTSAMRAASSRIVPQYHLPLVTLRGRSDYTLKFNAANIYPENIKAGLSGRRFLRTLTGRFVMQKLLDKTMDELLQVNIELSPNAKANKQLECEIQECLTNTLLKVNLEYADVSRHLEKDVRPRVVLWPYQHPQYFKPGLKPRFIYRS